MKFEIPVWPGFFLVVFHFLKTEKLKKIGFQFFHFEKDYKYLYYNLEITQ